MLKAAIAVLLGGIAAMVAAFILAGSLAQMALTFGRT